MVAEKTKSERGMEIFMDNNHNKQQKINALLKAGKSEISKYFENPTKDNIEYLFQKDLGPRTYIGFLDITKHFSAANLADRYIKHMTNSVTKGYGVFKFVTNLKKDIPKAQASLPSKLKKEAAKKAKEEKVEVLDMNNAVEVLEVSTKKEQKGTEKMNEVGLFTDMFEGHKVRVLGTPEEPLFVLSDVCKVLELGNVGQVKSRLEDGVISNDVISDSMGRKRNTVLINEDGLFDVVLDSRKPQAKRFRQWVTGTVLPSIRKTGKYEIKPEPVMDTQALLSSPKFLVEISIAYANAVEAKEVAEKLVEEARPKVEYHDQVLNSENLITVTQVSKAIGMTARDLNRLLKEKGMIYKVNGTWTPKWDFQWIISEGFARYRVTVHGQQLRWTERGRKMIHKIVKEDLTKRQIKALRNIKE